MATIDFHKLSDEFAAAWQGFKRSNADRSAAPVAASGQRPGNRPRIDVFLDRAADSERSVLLRELIQIELWWRRDESPQPDLAEYQSRFSDQHSIVDEAFQQKLSNDLKAQANQPTVIPAAVAEETRAEQDSDRYEARLSSDAPQSKFGRYRLLKELGRGGMGAVYLAHDEQLDRKVALKIPTFRESVRDEMLARFYREARAAAALRDPGICPVYDVGEINGQAFIAMAFIEGRPLRDYTKSGKPHDATKTARVIRRLAVAMAEAHQANIVHRDLKPANIMMEKGRRPVIMDFGLAYSTTEMESRLTGTGAILGTPTYMSPEQAAGETASIGKPTDIYSLGVIFYEMLAGRVPFEGNVMAVLTQIATTEPKPLNEYEFDIDPAVAAIVSRMMARKAEDRFASMDEVVAELKTYLHEGSPDAEKLEADESVDAGTGPKSKSLQTLSGAVSSSAPAPQDVDQSTARQTATDAGTTPGRPLPQKRRRSATRQPDKWGDAASDDESGDYESGDYEYDDYAEEPGYSSRQRRGGRANSRKKSSQSKAVFSPMVLGGVVAGIVVLSILGFVLFGPADSGTSVVQTENGSQALGEDADAGNTSGTVETASSSGSVAAIGNVSNVDSLPLSTISPATDNSSVTPVTISEPEKPQTKSEINRKLPATADNSTQHPGPDRRPSDEPPSAIAPFTVKQAKLHQEAWAKYLAIPVEFENSIGMKFRLIPPGEFQMGSTTEEIRLELARTNPSWTELIQSQGPQHKVTLTQPVYVAVTEVTQIQYAQVLGTNPSHFAVKGEGKEAVVNLETNNHPVEMVSWHNAAEFCAKLSRREKLKPFYLCSPGGTAPLDGTGYRLPSEAEWEWFCRAGTTTRYWAGDNYRALDYVSWWSGTSDGRTHPVAELSENPFGLTDIHGNVWEWVQDSWHSAFYEESVQNGAIDPSRDYYGASDRVLRGGAWHDSPRLCSSSRRLCHAPNRRLNHIGFRVLLSTESFRMPRAPLAPVKNTEQKAPNRVRNQSGLGTDIP